jgi:hypothetical protein
MSLRQRIISLSIVSVIYLHPKCYLDHNPTFSDICPTATPVQDIKKSIRLNGRKKGILHQFWRESVRIRMSGYKGSATKIEMTSLCWVQSIASKTLFRSRSFRKGVNKTILAPQLCWGAKRIRRVIRLDTVARYQSLSRLHRPYSPWFHR